MNVITLSESTDRAKIYRIPMFQVFLEKRDSYKVEK